MAIQVENSIQNYYMDAMRYAQQTYGNVDPQLNTHLQQGLMQQAFYSNQHSMMRYMNAPEQQDYIRWQMGRMQQEYEYAYRRYEGPTQQELDRNPSLRDAWEQYMIVKELSK